MNILQAYVTFSTIMCFVALVSAPRKMGLLDNIMGSVILAVALGWAIWPFAIWYCIKAKREEREKRNGKQGVG